MSSFSKTCAVKKKVLKVFSAITNVTFVRPDVCVCAGGGGGAVGRYCKNKKTYDNVGTVTAGGEEIHRSLCQDDNVEVALGNRAT